MTPLIRGLTGLTHRLWARGRRSLRLVRDHLVGGAQRATRCIASRATVIVQRHRDRIADDPGYARSIASAATAMATTVVTHPVIAAVVTTALATWLTQAPHATHRRDRFADTSDYGLADDYDSERAWSAPVPHPQPAWDIFRD